MSDKKNGRIRMGNDEFILYIRKHTTCELPNDQLGRRIWEWLRDEAKGIELGVIPCRWGSEGEFISATNLPHNAMQFEFDRDRLPALFSFLDGIA